MEKMQVDIWTNQDMQNYIDNCNYPRYKYPNGKQVFQGFQYFGPDFINPEKEFSERDRHVVATKDVDVTGLCCVHYGFQDLSFPHYYIHIVEVRQDMKNRKIASSLIDKLRQASFLEKEILVAHPISYTSEGYKYLKKTIEKQLSQGNFRLLDGRKKNLEDYS